jgi:uroporphyrinogen decarboxylase
MTSKERFHATIERQPVDRPAWWLGDPLPETIRQLCAFYGAAHEGELKKIIDDDVSSINIPFHCPPTHHIACAFNWVKDASYNERTLTAPGFFQGMKDPDRISDFDWPDPAEHMTPDEIRATIETTPQDKARLALLWSAHFQDACAAFGMEDALIAMLERPDMFRAVIDRIAKFYLDANAIVYKAAADLLDGVLIGNDVGGQSGLMLSGGLIREFMLPGTRALIQQAHDHGLKVIHHSCGSIHEVIGDFVAVGADAIHPIQALATGMSAESLAVKFGDTVSYCGGLDVQHLMVHGTPEDVAERVRSLRNLFPTGLIISPSHEALLPDVPAKNVEALRQAMAQ